MIKYHILNFIFIVQYVIFTRTEGLLEKWSFIVSLSMAWLDGEN